MVKGLYKKPQLISAFIFETEIEIALRNARGPLRQSQNGGRELFGQAEAKPDGTEDVIIPSTPKISKKKP